MEITKEQEQILDQCETQSVGMCADYVVAIQGRDDLGWIVRSTCCNDESVSAGMVLPTHEHARHEAKRLLTEMGKDYRRWWERLLAREPSRVRGLPPEPTWDQIVEASDQPGAVYDYDPDPDVVGWIPCSVNAAYELRRTVGGRWFVDLAIMTETETVMVVDQWWELSQAEAEAFMAAPAFEPAPPGRHVPSEEVPPLPLRNSSGQGQPCRLGMPSDVKRCGITFFDGLPHIYMPHGRMPKYVRIYGYGPKTLEAHYRFDGWVDLDLHRLNRLLEEGARSPDTQYQEFVAPIRQTIEAIGACRVPSCVEH